MNYSPRPAKTFERGLRPAKAEMSILQALSWAFTVEHARIDFDDLASDGVRRGIDTIAVLMDRGHLGCKVDGGGHSLPACDASTIADAVAGLPEGMGGRGMALQIAAYARSGTVPNWMPDAVPRLVPQAWARENQHGQMAATEQKGVAVVVTRGRKVEYPVLFCPVTWAPSAATIAAARRHYLQWWSALLHLRCGLTHLDRITLTKAMPPLKPWAK